MALPGLVIAIAAAGGALGGKKAVHGVKELKAANDIWKAAKKEKEESEKKLSENTAAASQRMDELGELELHILSSFEEFSDVIERIHNKPQLKTYDKEGITIPEYDREIYQKAYVGAKVLLSGLGSVAAGTAGGYAAAGAVSAAVMTFGTASTGTAIASLHGAAAANATLAALGGGSLAAEGGGMALGVTVLGTATLGIGLMVGGIIFDLMGKKQANRIDKAAGQAEQEIRKIDEICRYLNRLKPCAEQYMEKLNQVNAVYQRVFGYVSYLVIYMHKCDWNTFSEEEKKAVENVILLAGLLYEMCRLELVIKSENQEGINRINEEELNRISRYSEEILAAI